MKKESKQKTNKLQIALPTQLDADLNTFCVLSGLNRTEVCRTALLQFLMNNLQQLRQFKALQDKLL